MSRISRRSSLTSPVFAWRAVSPARRFLLCVFVDKPFVPMDNNRAELALRGAVTMGSLCTSLSTT